jgi:hypothetical protein
LQGSVLSVKSDVSCGICGEFVKMCFFQDTSLVSAGRHYLWRRFHARLTASSIGRRESRSAGTVVCWLQT